MGLPERVLGELPSGSLDVNEIEDVRSPETIDSRGTLLFSIRRSLLARLVGQLTIALVLAIGVVLFQNHERFYEAPILLFIVLFILVELLLAGAKLAWGDG